MIGLELAESLVRAAQESEALTDRLDAIAILARLPLEEDVWREVAVAAASVLRELAESGQLDDAAIDVFVRIPVRSVRDRLLRIARDHAHPTGRAVALALARERDVRVATVLADSLTASPSEEAAYALASLPLERLELAPATFDAATKADDPMVRFWGVLAQARLGAGGRAFADLWRALVRQSHDQDTIPDTAVFRESPPLFWGDPAVVYERLAALRPLPLRLQLALLNAYHGERHRRQTERGDGGDPSEPLLSRDALLLYGALSGRLDVHGEPIARGDDVASQTGAPRDATSGERPAPNVAEAESVARAIVNWSPDSDYRYTGGIIRLDWRHLHDWHRLNPEGAGRVLVAGIDALGGRLRTLGGRETRESMPEIVSTNDAFLDLVTALPRPIDVSPNEILSVAIDVPLVSRSVDWTMAQLEPRRLVVDFCRRVDGTSGEARSGWLARMRGIAEHFDAPPPYAGPRAGGDGGGDRANEPRVIIDDLTHRSARPESRGAESSAPPPPLEPEAVELPLAEPPIEEPPVPEHFPPPPAPPPMVSPAPSPLAPAPPSPSPLPPAASEPPAPQPLPPPPPEPRTLFPDIAVSELHPVVGASVAIDVALSTVAVPRVRGSVSLPAATPDTVHRLDVHLLAGNASLWDTLEYSDAKGTIKRAHFDITAPRVPNEDRALLDVRVNFYLDKRWAGEGSRYVDVRRDDTVAALAEIPTPEEPEWRQLLSLERGATPPDLILRIQRTASAGEYVWSCLSPHLDFPAPNDPLADRMALGKNAEAWVRDQFFPLAEVSLEALDVAEIEGIGEAIYRETALVFKEAYWALWNEAQKGGLTFESIQIITDEPYIPWELMRIADDVRAPEVDPEFLSIRHSVGRWLATDSARLTQTIRVARLAVAASSYKGIAGVPELRGALRESKAFTKAYRAQRVKLASKELLEFLEKGDAGAVHISCHGTMSVEAPLQSALTLEDVPRKLRPTHVNRAEVRRGLGRAHPLVFLNACEVGGTSASISLVSGFPAAFIGAGASAVVSPLWAVFDENAFDISQTFYKELFKANGRRTVGEVMREIRASWKDNTTITYLAYVLYGDPLARVHYTPPPSA